MKQPSDSASVAREESATSAAPTSVNDEPAAQVYPRDGGCYERKPDGSLVKSEQ